MKKLITLTLFTLSFLGNVANAETASVESILGFNFNDKGITFQVNSGGCTGKRSFELKQLETYPVQIQLVRVQPDYCEAYLPYGTNVSYTYEELGLKEGSEFRVNNPFGLMKVFRF